MAQNIKYFILTGDPGIGKTTMTKKLCSLLSSKGVKIMGFITEEVRQNKVREGFDIVSLDGDRGRLAREQTILPTSVKFSVGKYGVLVQEFENIALPSLRKADDSSTVLVIDEIGKMEFFSESFKSRIREIFSSQSKNIVLATIPVRKSDPLIESIRNNNNSKVWTITKENRNLIYEDIFKEMAIVMKL